MSNSIRIPLNKLTYANENCYVCQEGRKQEQQVKIEMKFFLYQSKDH